MKIRTVMLAALVLLLPPVVLPAQSREEAYRRFVEQRRREFRDYYEQANAEFAARLRAAWEEFQVRRAEPLNPGPKPKLPPVAPAPEIPAPVPEVPDVRVDIPDTDLPDPDLPDAVKPDLNRRPKPTAELMPLPEKPAVSLPPADRIAVEHFGISVNLARPDRQSRLKSLQEADIADYWSDCADGRFRRTLEDLAAWREAYGLCDWAFYLLVRDYSEQLVSSRPEAAVIQFFLMTQSGYSTRLARCGNELLLVAASGNRMSGRLYFEIDGDSFFVLDDRFNPGPDARFRICNFQFPKERRMDLFLPEPPRYPFDTSRPETRTAVSKRYPDLSLTLALNPNLKAFYAAYPMTNDLNVYAGARLSQANLERLERFLAPQLAGLSQREAANRLINLVQTGFEYRTDEEQFGRERPMFAEELFLYPYSDCEDRSALFACLVEELLGLDVLIVRFPGHAATAVAFTEPVSGDALEYRGRRYLICDPTYIGAEIGSRMPGMDEIREILPVRSSRDR